MIVHELQAIYEAHGKLTPAIVLEAAREPEHPLHNRFEWDDTVAAEAHRQRQARDLIRSVDVTYRPSGVDRSRKIRAFVSVIRDEEQIYAPVLEVMANEVTRKQLIGRMQNEWSDLYRRYADMEEFGDMVRRDLGDGPAPPPA